MANSSVSKNFEFQRMVSNWAGYISSVDRTNLAENVMVRGSQNIYKKLSGTLAVRQGQKRQGVTNATLSPISSSFPWTTSQGNVNTMVVSNSTLSVVRNEIWYPLQTGLTATRYVFDAWWDAANAQDTLLFVNGSTSLFSWSGGFATIASTSKTAISMVGNNVLLTNGALVTGTGPFTSSTNNPTGATFPGTSFQGSMVFTSNPTNGQTLILNINATLITIHFVSVIGAAAGNVLIGVDLATTLTHLLGLLQAPATTNANQVALSGPNQTLVGYVTWASTSTITISGTDTWFQNGFTTTGSITIGGATYAYTGGNTTLTLFGVTPDPTVIVPGVALQTIVEHTNIYAPTYNPDFLKVVNNQVYLGSYISRLIPISKGDDFTDYTIPTPRVAQDPGLVTLDGAAKGIGVRQGNATVGYGSNGWMTISFSDITVGTDVVNIINQKNSPVAILQAPLAHEFIDSVGDNLIYLAQDQQLRAFGDFNNLFVAGYPSYSQDVATELSEETFTGGALKCIGEFVYISAPNSGKVYLRQERTRVDSGGNVVNESLWHSPFIWNATAVNQIDGTVVVFSNANPQIYAVWDTNQWHDDSPSGEFLPYSCVCALSYRGEQRRQGLWSGDKNFTEGYITAGTPLMLQMNYGYQGVTSTVNVPINTVARPAFLFQTPLASLGDNSLGDEPLGNGGITEAGQDPDTLPKFKVINSLPIVNCFEYQPIFYTDFADAQWEILATATNFGIEPDEQANFIINKLRSS